jgi:hypothetical protein
MDTKIALDHFGSIKELALRCGVTYQAVHQWEKAGVIPVPRDSHVRELMRKDLGAQAANPAPADAAPQPFPPLLMEFPA